MKKLEIMGEYPMPDDYKAEIQVVVDTEGKSISFTDTGLGMTADELDEYINQVAFSGATDFLEKYKDKTNEEQIIGHFGLGFYSAFMVADRVVIDTLSYQEGAAAVRWESEGGINFEMTDGIKDTVGTTITLYLKYWKNIVPLCRWKSSCRKRERSRNLKLLMLPMFAKMMW